MTPTEIAVRVRHRQTRVRVLRQGMREAQDRAPETDYRLREQFDALWQSVRSMRRAWPGRRLICSDPARLGRRLGPRSVREVVRAQSGRALTRRTTATSSSGAEAAEQEPRVERAKA